LTVLVESTAKRCPACHSKLRRRSQPIVLGETSRLDLQTSLPIDRQTRKQLDHGYWTAERPAAMPAKFERTSFTPSSPPAFVVDPAAFVAPKPEITKPEITKPEITKPEITMPEATTVEPGLAVVDEAQAIFVEAEPELELQLEALIVEPEPALELEAVIVEPEPEPELEPYPFFEPVAFDDDPEPEPEPAPSFLDLALAGLGHTAATEPKPDYADFDDAELEEPFDAEPEPEPVPTPSFLDLTLAEHVRKPVVPARSEAELDAALDGDVNSVVDALHRKARGERIEVEAPPVQLFEDAEPSNRSLRLMAPTSANRRRWNIDFKSRRGDDV
jgi:hypothetical protein